MSAKRNRKEKLALFSAPVLLAGALLAQTPGGGGGGQQPSTPQPAASFVNHGKPRSWRDRAGPPRISATRRSSPKAMEGRNGRKSKLGKLAADKSPKPRDVKQFAPEGW